MAPADAPTVVIGAGLVGICTALYLQRAGHKVVTVERTGPGDGASGHNGGIFSIGAVVPTATGSVLRSIPHMVFDRDSALSLHWSYLPKIAPWLTRFVRSSGNDTVERISIVLASLLSQSLEAYEPLLRDIPEGLVREGGLLYAYQSDAVFEASSGGREMRKRRGIPFEVLDQQDLTAMAPLLGRRFERALYLRDAPFTPDPLGMTRALADVFTANGGEIVIANVQGFVPDGGSVSHLQTSTGRIRAKNVVVAAGAWSHHLTRMLGDRVLLETERGYGMTVTDPGFTVPCPVISVEHHVGFIPTPEGLRVMGISELASLASEPDVAVFDRLSRAAKKVFPEAELSDADSWMSYRPSTPDSLPVIDRATRAENVYYAFGHGHTGFTVAAVTGRLVTSMIAGEDGGIDLEPFNVRRFARWRRARAGK